MRKGAGLLGMVLLVLLSALTGVGLTWWAWQRAPKRVAFTQPLPPLEKAALVQKHIAAKEAITWRVIGKEMSLFDAAVWFRRLNQEAGYHQEPYWQRLAGESPEEKTCRQVITWVRRRLEQAKSPPSQVEAIAGALERQLDEHIAEHGKVVLPDGP